MVKNQPTKSGDAGETGSIPESGRSPGGGNGNSLQYSSDATEQLSTAHIPVFVPGEFQGQKSLEGYSPGGCKELDTTEHACTHTHTLLVIELEAHMGHRRETEPRAN